MSDVLNRIDIYIFHDTNEESFNLRINSKLLSDKFYWCLMLNTTELRLSSLLLVSLQDNGKMYQLYIRVHRQLTWLLGKLLLCSSQWPLVKVLLQCFDN